MQLCQEAPEVWSGLVQFLHLHVKPGLPAVHACRCKNCTNTPSPTGKQQLSSDELVEIEEEELLHDD